MADYKDRRRKVDEMKEDLQKRITEYSKLAESGIISNIPCRISWLLFSMNV
jgi:hypothetical protein